MSEDSRLTADSFQVLQSAQAEPKQARGQSLLQSVESARAKLYSGNEDAARALTDFGRHTLLSQSPLFRTVSKASGDCKGDVTGKAQLSGGRVDADFSIRISSCPIKDANSTGKVRFALRVRDAEGRQDMLGPFVTMWVNRQGTQFNHSDRVTLRADEVDELLEVVDERIVDCGCFK